MSHHQRKSSLPVFGFDFAALAKELQHTSMWSIELVVPKEVGYLVAKGIPAHHPAYFSVVSGGL